MFILISFNSIANTTVSTSSALRAAIQAAVSSHSIMVQGITPALEANGYSVLTFAKRSSFVPASTPFSGYTAQGTSTTLSSSALLVDSLIFLQDVDGANAAGTAKNFTLNYVANCGKFLFNTTLNAATKWTPSPISRRQNKKTRSS